MYTYLMIYFIMVYVYSGIYIYTYLNIDLYSIHFELYHDTYTMIDIN